MPTDYASAPPHLSDPEVEKTIVASLLTTLASATRLVPATGRGARSKHSNAQSAVQDVADVVKIMTRPQRNTRRPKWHGEDEDDDEGQKGRGGK